MAHHHHHHHGPDVPLNPALPGHQLPPFATGAHALQSASQTELHNRTGFSEAGIANGPMSPDIKGETEHLEAASIASSVVFANPWARIRADYRVYFAEFLGTMLLIIFGTGVDSQVVLSGLVKGSYLSISWGWGIGVFVGVHVSGGISGGHINPAVTVALATFRKFPWRKVPGYVFAQVLGAFCGAAITQGLYSGAINAFEGGAGIRTFTTTHCTAALWFTAPASYVTNVTCFFSEFANTAILMIFVFAISDSNNLPPPLGLGPLALLFLIVGIGACLGWQTAYCLNPARDFGPRLALWALGYPRNIWTDHHAYWIWTPIIATTLGGLAGALIYDVLIYEGDDSWVNGTWGKKKIATKSDASVA